MKSSWTTLYIYQVMPGMTTYPVPTAAAVPTAAPVAKVKALLWPTKRATATMRETLAKFMSVMLKLDFADNCLFHYSVVQLNITKEIEVFSMLFDRVLTVFTGSSFKNHI